MLELVLALALLGLILFLIEKFIPMDPTIVIVIRVVVVICVIVYLMRLFVADIPLPRAR